MKCKNCNGTGNIANGMWLCCECEGTGYIEDEMPQKMLTNEEYIRTCSTEELAIFLCNELQHDVNGTLEWRFFRKLYSQYPIRPMNAYNEVMRWLKEKHNE